MPRTLLERRYWKRVSERAERRKVGVQAQWRVLRQPAFIDYWPWIPATYPEKLVFAALVGRQINFFFSWYLGDLPITRDTQERYRPDFLLPDYNIIIEIFGVYWHTRPGMFEYDYERTLRLELQGYKVYPLTDTEVIDNVEEALNSIPEISGPTITGNMHIVGDRPFNPTAAIRSRIRRWPRQFVPHYLDKVRGDVGVASKWRAARAPKRPKRPVDPMFTGFTDEGRALIREQARKIRRTDELFDRYNSLTKKYFGSIKKTSRVVASGNFDKIFNFVKRMMKLLRQIIDVLKELDKLDIDDEWVKTTTVFYKSGLRYWRRWWRSLRRYKGE